MTETANTIRLRAARDLLVAHADHYDRALAEFAWPEIGETFNWAIEWFDVIAQDNDRPALWIVEQDGTELQVSFAELARRSDQLAGWFSSVGISQGDRVMTMLGNQVELWESVLALMKLGAVLVPSTTALGTRELRDRIERGGIRHVIANTVDADKFDEVQGEYTRISIGARRDGWIDYAASADSDLAAPAAVVHPDDPLLVYFTSGTTSLPKMVVHTQTTYPVGHLSTMYWLGLRPGDVHMAISAPGWAKHAWSLVYAPWLAGATVFIYNYDRLDPAALVRQLDRAGVNTFCAPPTVWRMLIQADALDRPHALREIVSAGEPLNPEVIARIQDAWELTIRDGYGQTELTAVVANTPGTPIVPGSMGRPLPGVPVVLVDPVTGARGADGELCIDLSGQPRNLMAGYLDDAQRNASVLRDGMYHTGDVATLDDQGFITYVGRTDDVFKSSDFRISPFEVESILLEHPAVAEVAVVPAPHETRQTVPKAYVALAAGWAADEHTARAILEHSAATMPKHMRVRRVEFAELPKTISGKIRRVDLRRRENDAAESTTPIASEWREEQFK